MIVDGYLDKDGAATFLGVTTRTIENWQRRGFFAYYKVGRFTLYKKSDLIAAVESGKRINERLNRKP